MRWEPYRSPALHMQQWRWPCLAAMRVRSRCVGCCLEGLWWSSVARTLPLPPPCPTQAMVVIGGVNPSEDLNDVALWLPGRNLCIIEELDLME